MKKEIICVLFLLTFCTSAFAFEESRGKVIDLGELQVKGDIRRPSTTFYQLKSLTEQQLLEISELTFNDFERKILEIKKDRNHE